MGKIIGIDLGTSNSCCSVMQGGNAIIIANDEGKRTTPSIIGFLENGEIKVGEPAKRQAVTNPLNTVYSVKRFMGKRFKDTNEEDREVPYTVEKGTNDSIKIKINDRDYTPQELSAYVLQKIKKYAEDYLGEEVTEAVITVPAYFNDSERQATKEAGQIAGLNVRRIINEPTAAALAYGLDKKDDDVRIAVYDLGGGTFDISILELGDGIFEVKSTNGDVRLGGDDFDKAIIDWVVEGFKNKENIDISKDSMALQRVREAAEKAKVELSNTSETEINLPYLTADASGPKHFVEKLSRAHFERLTDELVERSIKPCQQALKDAGIDKSEIDEVILVGGSTRIPKVQEAVEKFFGKKPSKGVNPDEVVAMGAAIQGGVLAGDVKDVLLLDVTPLSLGIETVGGVMTRLIDSNTTIPVNKKQSFSTAVDNQSGVEVHVLQGERAMSADNKSVGKFMLDGIPPAPRGVPQIEVTFDIDVNGILKVSAKDLGTGKEQQIRIEGSTGLSDEEIARMRKDAEENAAADEKKKEKIDALNKADGLLFSTEKQLKEFGEKMEDSEKENIESLMKQLSEAKENEDMDQITKLSDDLSSAWHSISERIYKQGAAENAAEDAPPQNEGTEDVDYEDVE